MYRHKIFLSFTVIATMLFLNIPPVYALTFKDVKSTDWFANSVYTLANKGVISGYKDGSFKPQSNITRSEFLALLLKALGKPIQPNGAPWMKVTVQKARSIKILLPSDMTKGMTQALDKPITRKEVALLATRSLSFVGETLTEQFYDYNRSIKDSNTIPLYYEKPILQAIAAGVMKGHDDKMFMGNAPLTRAEAAVTVNRILNSKLRKIPTSTKVSMPTLDTPVSTKTILKEPDAYVIPSLGLNVTSVKVVSPDSLPMEVVFNEEYQRYSLKLGRDWGKMILFANGQNLGTVPAATDNGINPTGEYLIENTYYHYADHLGFIKENDTVMTMVANPLYRKNVDRSFSLGETGTSLMTPGTTYKVSDVINHPFSGSYLTTGSHPAVLTYHLQNYQSVTVLGADPYGVYFDHTGEYIDLIFPGVSFEEVYFIKGTTPIGYSDGVASNNTTTVSISKGNPYDDEDAVYRYADYLAISTVKNGQKQLIAFPNPFLE